MACLILEVVAFGLLVTDSLNIPFYSKPNFYIYKLALLVNMYIYKFTK